VAQSAGVVEATAVAAALQAAPRSLPPSIAWTRLQAQNNEEETMISRACLAGVLAAAVAFGAGAQEYPVKPVRIVVGFPAASGADIVARTVAGTLSERFRQQVVTDPRPGASGIIAAKMVLSAPPDGHTLMLGTSSSHAISMSMHKDLPYHAVRDFAPVSMIAVLPMLMVIHPAVPAKNVKGYIALAKAQHGQLTMGSSGVGTTTHLAGELFVSMAGIKTVHVPYKGSPQSLIELVGGQVTTVFCPILTGLPHVATGKVRALAVTTAERTGTAPELPTVAESGLPGYEATLWYGLFAPAGTPREIVSRLSAEVVAAVKLADVRDSFRKQGADAVGMTPEQFGAYQKAEIEKWAKVVKAAGVTEAN
jgi:tripartite-type tricarboxylate transporter receptor subunit TctC